MTGKITGLVDRINHVSRSNLVLQARFRPRQRSGHYGFQQYSPLDRRLTRMEVRMVKKLAASGA